MASALQQAVASIEKNNYGTLAILTAVGYDYILTFSDEIEHIWNKPWTYVSTLFFLARYFGLCCVLTIALFGSSFLPGPTLTYVSTSRLRVLALIFANRLFLNSCSVILVFNEWANTIFIAAADLVMILRVWALYGRSRFILAALLPLYATEVISFLILSGVYSNVRNYPQGVVTQVLDFSACQPNYTPAVLLEVVDIAQMTLSGSMCLFITVQYVKQSLQIYRVSKKFQLSSYMKILTGHSVFYFLSILMLSLINLLSVLNIPVNIVWILAQYIPAFTLVPRFTLSLRKTYARELMQRDGSGIDTAFGFKSTGHGAVPSAVLFADAGKDEESDQFEDITLDDRAVHSVSGV